MATISDKTLQYLRDQYEQNIENWFDDPDEQFTGWNHAEFVEWYNDMLAIGEEIGTPFWQVAWAQATDYEIDQVQEMLKEAGVEFPVKT